jgi:hypothetical protein
VLYIRYESPTPNSRGTYTGIFGLANGLARSGRLSPTDWSWWRTNNDWLDAAYPDPATVDPTLFDKTKNPIVTCWFKDTAAHLLDRVDGTWNYSSATTSAASGANPRPWPRALQRRPPGRRHVTIAHPVGR